jgi:hypothetical protein
LNEKDARIAELETNLKEKNESYERLSREFQYFMQSPKKTSLEELMKLGILTRPGTPEYHEECIRTLHWFGEGYRPVRSDVPTRKQNAVQRQRHKDWIKEMEHLRTEHRSKMKHESKDEKIGDIRMEEVDL